MNELLDRFQLFLKINNISPVTANNYLADLRHFLKWLLLYTSTRDILINENYPYSIAPYITSDLVGEYKASQVNLQTNHKTINRRLSALAKFSEFLISQKQLTYNPLASIPRISEEKPQKKNLNAIISEFTNDLKMRKVNPTTIINYSADIKQFLEYVQNLTTPHTPGADINEKASRGNPASSV